MLTLSHCSLCPAVAHRRPIPWQERLEAPDPDLGFIHTRILIVGEGPSYEEDRRSTPFVGKTGREFNEHYLPLASLHRSCVWITNAAHCSLLNYDNPDPALAASCASLHLRNEIKESRPEVIVVLGSIAASLFSIDSGDPHSGAIDLERHHGYAYPGEFLHGPWSGWVFVAYHPSAGLRDNDYMMHHRSDFRNLELFLKGQLTRPSTPPASDYRLLTTLSDFHDTIVPELPDLSIDTEHDTLDRRLRTLLPFCLSFSQQPGTGYMIRSGSPLIPEFVSFLRARRPYLWLHNLPHDVLILDLMSVPLSDLGLLSPLRATDTMMESYHRANLPQSLKVLTYRLLGVVMREYEDVVLPWGKMDVWIWLDELETRLKREAYVPNVLRNGTVSKAKPWLPNRDYPPEFQRLAGKLGKLKNDLSDLDVQVLNPRAKNPRKKVTNLGFSFDRAVDIDPWKRYHGWSDWDRDVIEAFAAELQLGGQVPEPAISRVPLADSVPYACADADLTLQVGRALRRLGPARRIKI